MSGSDSDAAREGLQDQASPEPELAGGEPAEADRAAEDLRGQIAALRRQVKDAQETLRQHHRRAGEDRTFTD